MSCTKTQQQRRLYLVSNTQLANGIPLSHHATLLLQQLCDSESDALPLHQLLPSLLFVQSCDIDIGFYRKLVKFIKYPPLCSFRMSKEITISKPIATITHCHTRVSFLESLVSILYHDPVPPNTPLHFAFSPFILNFIKYQ